MELIKNDVTAISVSRAERTSWSMNNVLKNEYMVTMTTQIDVSALEKLRSEAKQKGDHAPSFTALVVKAAAFTIKNNPQANRAILGLPFFKRLYQFQNCDISVAVEKNLPSLPGQAFATPIKNTLDKSAEQISNELQELANCDENSNASYRSFMNILKYVPRPLSLWLINAPYWFPKMWTKYRGCACWVNAPSKAGADVVFTTWPWPITFSFGIVKKRPIVIDDKIEIRPTMNIVMVFDRRIMGGGPASRIFAQFKEILESGLN